MTEGVVPEEAKERTGEGNRVIVIETRKKVPRECWIRKEDCEKHGYTRGCGGCGSWFEGLARQPHNEACRERF